MIDSKKAVFLPAAKQILDIHQRDFTKEAHIVKDLKKDKESFWGRVKKLFFRERGIYEKKKEKEPSTNENNIKFLNRCKNCLTTVYLYSYAPLSEDEQVKVKSLIKEGYIAYLIIIEKLSDLAPFIISENISVLNSLLVITNPDERFEADRLGFQSSNGWDRNVELLKDRNQNGKGELEWNSNKNLFAFSHRVEYYLKSETSSFIKNETILFLEDDYDEALNNYILKNHNSIRERLKQKGKDFIYFPIFQLNNDYQQSAFQEFIKYHSPVFYSLTESELNEVLQTTLKGIKPVEFYRSVLEDLQLPYFERPCLLRRIPNDFISNPKFTYAPIKYQNDETLDNFFAWYIEHISKDELDKPEFRAVRPPKEYDADWRFGVDGKELSEELKQKIDAYKNDGKYGALVEAIMYMLETIKEEKPEIIDKVKPLLEQRKLLESKVVLSPLVIDKHCNIFLPAYGNVEVKMHALPKTVFLLFLRYPNGIRFKELYEYKNELLDIYNKVTNKYEKDEIERAIDDLVDMTKPSINQKCARIREAFRNIMSEQTAKYYYIDGANGEPKSIALPRDLISIQK